MRSIYWIFPWSTPHRRAGIARLCWLWTAQDAAAGATAWTATSAAVAQNSILTLNLTPKGL
ncbi:hypothetical protein Prum_007240 [Phytohabitans rumicis]|uniref:Uncharacterized protein n=1 Tax=Phytohabitans rumicis TaxID=1076125 RepID=A0A6V8KPI7_9ACTN|nr:hypothetical protein Prum_007240 [Phytohabitans rumicis]